MSPATWVPWSSRPSARARCTSFAVTKFFGAGATLPVEVRVLGVDGLVDHRDRDV